MKNSILKIGIILICLICFSGCSFVYDYLMDNYDPNLQYIQEEKRKEEERQQIIKSRNYIDENMNIYFSFLTDEEKQVYYDILENANKYNQEMFDLTYNTLYIDNIENIFNSVLFDNPELFWLKSYLYYTYEGEENVISLELKYYEDLEDLNLMKQKLNNITEKIVNETNHYLNDFEKEKFVHDKLAKSIEYDMDMKDDQRVYGALVDNKAVCAGYAKAFQLIMRKLNIPTYYISGDINEGDDTGPHAWNIIKLDDGLYNVDLTWNDDDKHDRIHYDYYNISDEIINKNHNRKDISLKIPNALGGKYSNLYK